MSQQDHEGYNCKFCGILLFPECSSMVWAGKDTACPQCVLSNPHRLWELGTEMNDNRNGKGDWMTDLMRAAREDALARAEAEAPNEELKKLMREEKHQQRQGAEAEPAVEERAKRHNKGKVDLSLLPRVASLEQCKVWMHGERKYGRDNWKKLWGPDTINVAGASAMRHLMLLISGKLYDEETGLPHAAHVACNMSMILEWMAQVNMIVPDVYKEKQ